MQRTILAAVGKEAARAVIEGKLQLYDEQTMQTIYCQLGGEPKIYAAYQFHRAQPTKHNIIWPKKEKLVAVHLVDFLRARMASSIAPGSMWKRHSTTPKTHSRPAEIKFC